MVLEKTGTACDQNQPGFAPALALLGKVGFQSLSLSLLLCKTVVTVGSTDMRSAQACCQGSEGKPAL